jgi:hypothetical protein
MQTKFITAMLYNNLYFNFQNNIKLIKYFEQVYQCKNKL